MKYIDTSTYFLDYVEIFNIKVTKYWTDGFYNGETDEYNVFYHY